VRAKEELALPLPSRESRYDYPQEYPNGLKGQKHIAQGNALGSVGNTFHRPERAKAFNNNAFALSGRKVAHAICTQGVALGCVLTAPSGRSDYHTYGMTEHFILHYSFFIAMKSPHSLLTTSATISRTQFIKMQFSYSFLQK
jgi:hypothetical protein